MSNNAELIARARELCDREEREICGQMADALEAAEQARKDAVKRERERCAKVCDNVIHADKAAELIRALLDEEPCWMRRSDMTKCSSVLATRPILYTDTVGNEQVCRDDLWAVTTDELNALKSAEPSARERKLVEALQSIARGPRKPFPDAPALAAWTGARFTAINALIAYKEQAAPALDETGPQESAHQDNWTHAFPLHQDCKRSGKR